MVSAARQRQNGTVTFLAKLLTPMALPVGVKSSDDMSEEEIVQEAQDARPLLREIGWRDSAVFHPDVMNLRYLRTCHYVGKLPIKPYVIQLAVTLGVAAGMAVLFLFGPTQEAEDLALGKGMFAIVGGLMGLVFGVGIGYSTRSAMQFWLAHAEARIAQKRTDENGIRKTVAVYELPLLRLAFADRHGEHMFSGIEDKSGFINGRMNLETDLDLSLITTPAIFYLPNAVRPCVSNFTGVSSARRYALNGMAKRAGRINAEKQANRENDDISNWIGEHKGLTFFIISVIVAIIVLSVGVEFDLSGVGDLGGMF